MFNCNQNHCLIFILVDVIKESFEVHKFIQMYNEISDF